jgi:CHAT domain-containing protein
MFTLSILIALFLNFGLQWNDYVEKYNQIGETPETVWASLVLYHSSPDSVKPYIHNSLESELIKSSLHQDLSFRESLVSVNTSFNDETILLLSLILEPDKAEREKLYEDFYSRNGPGPLDEINQFAVLGKVLNSTHYDVSEFKFKHFLLSFYLVNNKIVDNNFFKSFVEYWENRIPQYEIQDHIKELLVSTAIKSAYEIQDDLRVHRLYNSSQQLDFIPPSNLKRNFYWGIDYVHSYLGRIDESLKIQREYLIPLSNYLNDINSLNRIYIDKGIHLYELGNYQSAKNILVELYERSNELPTLLQVRLFNNLSLVYFMTGESSKYIATQLKALQLAKDLNNFDQQNQIYRNLHVFYRKYQNYDLAEQYINLATELALETGNTRDLISIYVSQAVFENQYLNNRTGAYNILDTAKSYFDEQTEPRLRIRVLNERSKLLNQDKRWEESKELQREIIQIAAGQNDTSTYLEALTDLAFIHFQLEQYRDSEQLLRELRAHDITILDFSPLVLAQSLRAQLSVVTGDFSDARRQFSNVTELVLERARNTSEHESGYWNVEKEYLDLFEAYADFLIESGDISEVINLFDRIKTINDASLTDNPLIHASHLSESDLARERQISQEMDRIRKRIFVTTGQERLSLQGQLEMLSAQRRSLIGRVSTSSDHQNLKVWGIQRNLSKNQLLLHIAEINSNYYLTRVDRNSVSIEKIPLNDQLTDLFKNAIQAIVTGRTDLNQLYEIGQLLNISSLPDRIQSIIFVPDGYFHQLPLSVIPVRQPASAHSYGSAKYLIEEIDIFTINSLIELSQSKSRGQFEHDFTGFGVSDFNNEITSRNLISLPKAPQEINNIQNILYRFPSVLSMINDRATTQNFRELAAGSRILHMATHSEVSESDPLFSRLHFYSDTPSQNGDIESGQLFAYELFNLNLNNELVMLNSCESGGDRYLQGSGIMGINRALRYAGVQSLILNSWSVNDKFAADFAELFYTYLNEGKTKSKALQLAKIDFIKTKNANPHYWGPYTMNGNNRPLLRGNRTSNSGYILLALFIIMAVSLRKGSLS